MSDKLDLVFIALADPTRRKLLDRLFAQPGQTLGNLIKGLGMRRQSASKHLAVLESAGLVVSHWEGREKLHYLNPVPITEIATRWVDKYSQPHAQALVALREALEGDTNERTGVRVRGRHRRTARKGVARADDR